MVKRIVFARSDDNWEEIEDIARNAVVQVLAQVGRFNWENPYSVEAEYESRGSGFFIDERGFLLTNAHVVDGAKTVWIHVPQLGRQNIRVDVVGFCPERDVALLKIHDEDLAVIKQTLGEIPMLTLGDSDLVHRTNKVLVLGYPLGDPRMKGSTGIIGGREFKEGRSFLEFTAPIHPGNSGGPLLDATGQVIGVTIAAILKEQNIGYAIPINEIKLILDDLYNNKFLRRSFLGARFNISNDYLARYLNNPVPGGLYVNRIYKNSVFEGAGVQEGDMLYEFNGHTIDAFGETMADWSPERVLLQDIIARLHIGQEIKLVIYRKGERKEITVAFEQTALYPIRFMYPDYEQVEYEVIGGLVVMQLTDNHLPILSKMVPFLIEYAKTENKTEPVLVITHVLPGSQAQQVRSLVSGDTLAQVNEITVATMQEFRDAVLKSLETGYLTLKTKDQVFVVFALAEVLQEEAKLAKDFGYVPTTIVQLLITRIAAVLNS